MKLELNGAMKLEQWLYMYIYMPFEQNYRVSVNTSGGHTGELSCKDVCGLCSFCAESDREPKCKDLSALTAMASSDHCRKFAWVVNKLLE